MKTFDERPPGGRSPYEEIGRRVRGKPSRPQETKSASEPSASEAGGGAPCIDRGWDKLRKALNDEKSRLTSNIFDVMIDNIKLNSKSISFEVNDLRSTPHVDRKAEVERRLRQPVERFLLRAAPGTAWDDVVGNAAARAALVEAIEHPVQHAALYAHYGRKPARGVLLYGPPGCGKTMFGKAAAAALARLAGGVTDAPVLLHLKGPEVMSKWFGQTEETIRAIFAYARAYRARFGRPLAVFIDEADAILPRRDGPGSNWLQESIVATFLAEMDGLEESAAFVILATNRPEAIDEAILRDGRCDRKIRVARPDRAAAEAILARALAGCPVGAGGTAGALAQAAARELFAPGHVLAAFETDRGVRTLQLADIVSGAMLVGLVERAKGLAFDRDLAAGGMPRGLTLDELEAAIAAVAAENRGLSHGAALAELGEREGFRVARLLEPAGCPPRYALDAAGDVVRVQ